MGRNIKLHGDCRLLYFKFSKSRISESCRPNLVVLSAIACELLLMQNSSTYGRVNNLTSFVRGRYGERNIKNSVIV